MERMEKLGNAEVLKVPRFEWGVEGNAESSKSRILHLQNNKTGGQVAWKWHGNMVAKLNADGQVHSQHPIIADHCWLKPLCVAFLLAPPSASTCAS